MDNDDDPGQQLIPFYVGHHESRRKYKITPEVYNQATDCNYDILTTQITNEHFRSRVKAALSDSLRERSRSPSSHDAHHAAPPIISSLTDEDTNLTPSDVNKHMLAFTSPWIDVCSPDPIVASVSSQVLLMEIYFATFCGFDYVFIDSPRLCHEDACTEGISQFAKVIRQALTLSSHLQLCVIFPITEDATSKSVDDQEHFAALTRAVYLDDVDEVRSTKLDIYGTWDAWNVVRTACSYNNRLSVAIIIPRYLPDLSLQSRWFSESPRAIIFPSSTFVKNRSGFPTLLPPVQSYLSRLVRLKISPWILLGDVGTLPGIHDPERTIDRPDGLLAADAAATARESPTPAEAAVLAKKKRQIKKEYNGEDSLAHLNYIRYLQRNQPRGGTIERFSAGYEDYLQIPLQPLRDNLESATYEMFELDPIKYNLYELAIRKALRDWADQQKPCSGPKGEVVIVVAGAGRGPLVTRALHASVAEKVPIDLWALEKNPNSYVLLNRHAHEDDWRDHVKIVNADMREWKGPSREYPQLSSPSGRASFLASSRLKDVHASPTLQQYSIDIVVSELLGSFADYELSPECLDGITPLLAKPHGLSIPCSYSSFLTPIMAPRLYADISARTTLDPTAPETPCVVYLHAFDFLSLLPPSKVAQDINTDECKNAEDVNKSENHSNDQNLVGKMSRDSPGTPNIQEVWSFRHAADSQRTGEGVQFDNRHNERHAKLNFRIRYRGVCHGLAGYFECVLYPGVEMSTNPNTIAQKSPEMTSWFPAYFPLKKPLYLSDHSALTVSLWRQTDNRKVWYEWMVENWGWNFMLGGEKRKVRLGMSELHSSIKNPASL